MDSSVYYQGCIWGGTVPAVLDMIDLLQQRTDQDLERGIIALVNDESHINKFFSENKHLVHTLDPGFAFPEPDAAECDFAARIIHMGKDNHYFHNL
jgi:hypothetical protein